MKRPFFQILTVVCMAAVWLGLSAAIPVSAQEISEGKDSFQTNTPQKETEQEPETEAGNGFPKDAPGQDPDLPKQLTQDEIDAMNDGNAVFLYSEDGYLQFLWGRYYDEPVRDYEDGIRSLYGIQQLLGLSKGSEFFGVFGNETTSGYVVYTYQQRYGDLTLENAVLKVIVDPDGYTAGLVSSFTPNIGIAPEDESSISAEEALQVVQAQFPRLRFYPEETRQTSVTSRDGVAMHCWAVFSNLPSSYDHMEGAAYLEHLVSYDGEYLYYMSVSSPQEMVFGDDVRQEINRAMFEGLQADTYTGIVTEHDGTQKEVTVPVAYDPEEQIYYLADVERNILLTDYYQYAMDFSYDPITSADNTGWPDQYLLTYETYVKLYDFYDLVGIHSTDGFGCPILILTDWVDDTPPYDPVYNAAFLGYINGWAIFAASSIGNFEECVDVIGHEFTHAVTQYLMAGSYYMNEPGAINEAISDVAGNLIEMMLGDTQDTLWLIAENSGRTLRNMSFPWEYGQPATVGGWFYCPPALVSTSTNDNGGVHTNSSLVNSVAWKLHAAGMDPLEELYLFLDTAKLLTPLSDFRQFHQALLCAADMRGEEIEWQMRIDLYCEEAGY